MGSQRSGALLLDRASVTRVLTAAETLALNSTPIELVPAPGAGKVLVPESVVLSKPAGVAGAGGGNFNVRVGTGIYKARSRANAFPAAARTSVIKPDGDETVAENGSINVNMSSADMTGQDQDVVLTVVYSLFATE